jgi:hypothetical protein
MIQNKIKMKEVFYLDIIYEILGSLIYGFAI